MPIRSFVEENATFEPEQIEAMSKALDAVCAALLLTPDQLEDRKAVARRIIDLAHTGVIDAEALSDRVIAETRAMRAL